MQWSGEATRLLKTIDALASRKGTVSIDLLGDYVGSAPDRLIDTLREMASAEIVKLDEHAGEVSVRRR